MVMRVLPKKIASPHPHDDLLKLLEENPNNNMRIFAESLYIFNANQISNPPFFLT